MIPTTYRFPSRFLTAFIQCFLSSLVGITFFLSLILHESFTAYSILDDYQSQKPEAATTKTTTTVTKQQKDPSTDDVALTEWVKDQIPRVLLGIGDCLSALNRHADAADAYSRAHEHRLHQLQDLLDTSKDDGNGKKGGETLQHLQCQRRICEATVLIVEELLACPEDQDVVTTETQSLIVSAKERIDYAKGYYDKARDSLQETVYLLGRLASKKSIDLGTEKEDVCFLATMIMGVGERLAAWDEEHSIEEPVKKKAKKIK